MSFQSKRDEYLAVGGDKVAQEIEKLIVSMAAGERGQAELNSDEQQSNVLHQRSFEQRRWSDASESGPFWAQETDS